MIIIRGKAVEVEVDPYEKLQIHLELSGYTFHLRIVCCQPLFQLSSGIA